jgi:hypothetical protein
MLEPRSRLPQGPFRMETKACPPTVSFRSARASTSEAIPLVK